MKMKVMRMTMIDEENYVEMEFIGDDDVFEVVYL